MGPFNLLISYLIFNCIFLLLAFNKVISIETGVYALIGSTSIAASIAFTKALK